MNRNKSARLRKFTENGCFLSLSETGIPERYASNTPRITMPTTTAATAV